MSTVAEIQHVLPSRNPPPVQHKTLSNYLPHLYTLSSFIASLTGGPIEKPGDPQDLKDFFSATLCGFQEELVISKITYSSERSEVELTQQEAIDRIVNEVARQSLVTPGVTNVLTTVAKKYNIENFPVNLRRPHVPGGRIHSPAAAFLSLPWQILKRRLGDRTFCQFVVHSSLFSPIGSNCYLQLSGRPLYDVYDELHKKMMFASESVRTKRKCERKDKKGKKKRPKITDARGQEGSTHPREQLPPKPVQTKGLADMRIARPKIYFGKPSYTSNGKVSNGLPSSHILNTLKPALNQAPDSLVCLRLLQVMFPSIFQGRSGEDFYVKGSKKRLEKMVPVAREILIRHSRIIYGQVLQQCLRLPEEKEFILPPAPANRPSKTTFSQPITQALPSSPDTSNRHEHAPEMGTSVKEPKSQLLVPKTQRQVCWYVSTIIHKLFDSEVMGSRHNLHVLLKNVRRFITAKKFESDSLHSLMQEIRTNDFKWFRMADGDGQRVGSVEMEKRNRLTRDFISWIFEGFLIPLLRNTFYITETAMTKYETVYYVQEDWARLTRPHFEKLSAGLLEQLSPDEERLAHSNKLGVSAVRLIPKPIGFRPIVNLGKKIKQQQTLGIPLRKEWNQSANQILGDLHRVLSYEKVHHKELLGGSLYGTNEIFAPISQLKTQLMEKHGNIPGLYFVKMDIRAAFDSIKQEKMLRIVEDMLSGSEEYCIMLFSLLLPSASDAYKGTPKRLYKTKAVPSDDVGVSFAGHAAESAKRLRNAGIVDLVKRRIVTAESCMQLLRQHITDNFWQIGKKFYRQKTGIPQGSKISSLLCSFFYSYLENEHLTWARQKGSILLRYTDDFLYVTDNPSLARRFVQVMSRGFPDYGAEISFDKTLLSFEYGTENKLNSVCDVDGDGETSFPYCGFLINTRTLDLMQDYTRAISHSMKQSFARRFERREVSGFVSWYSRQLENRNHVGYLNTTHNNITTVQVNVFINFALTTMKVPHYFRQAHVDSRNTKLNRLICRALMASAEYTFKAGRARVKHHIRVDGLHDPNEDHYLVKKDDFFFLAITAMIKVLEKKVTRFKGIVDLLQSELRKRVCKALEEELRVTIEKAWDGVKGAIY